MQTHLPRHGTAVARPQPQHHLSAAVALPATGALAYGLYAVFLEHTNGGSWGSSWLLGLAAAVVVGALGVLLIRHQSALITEVRALAYGALFGAAMGFLYSLTGPSVLRATALAAALGAGMFAVALYVFRTHER